ncbi:F0F1 ATP synthase subunit delta [Microcystis elabens FACHB-917]|jgi:F-type H+-transporting ATPase subunit delta|nr:F0F1 ATP synthase subunit delta [Microcystis elabens FACHB-917]
MPLLNTITTPYADAFLEVCDASGDTEVVIDQARAILALWHDSSDLREAMASPVLEIDGKKAALEQLFGGSISPTFLNLLKLLADRQRIGILDAVLERLLDLYRERNNIALATVTSASPLSDDQQALLAEKARAVAGTEKVEISLAVDPALIGGFILRVGSRVIDSSLAGQVRRLGLTLANVS